MITAAFAEFKKNAELYINKVELGEVVTITRHGLPVAEVIPPVSKQIVGKSWKRTLQPVSIKGIDISKEIIADRRRHKQ